jgi:hypothetical protein
VRLSPLQIKVVGKDNMSLEMFWQSKKVLAIWETVYHGGRSWGIMRHCAPARTSQRSVLNTSRKECSRCGASSVIKVK